MALEHLLHNADYFSTNHLKRITTDHSPLPMEGLPPGTDFETLVLTLVGTVYFWKCIGFSLEPSLMTFLVILSCDKLSLVILHAIPFYFATCELLFQDYSPGNI